MVTEELRRQARVAELLLDDRPRGVAEAMRVELGHPVRGTKTSTHILSTADGEPLATPGVL